MREPPRETVRPADVLLDAEFADGLLFLVLANVGELPAHAVRVKFEQPLRGLGGEKRIDRLALFRKLEFLGPGRSIRVLLDRSSLFFARDEPTRITATVTWRGDEGERRSRTIDHDLEVYRDLAYLEVPRRAHET